MGVIDDEAVRERVKAEAEKIRKEIERQYELKIRELEKAIAEFQRRVAEQEEKIKKLRGILRSREYYLAKLDGLIREAEDAEEILGEETAEELKNRVEALKLRLLGASNIEVR
jgi:septal ring factor EnvC (AmiA/AmiB activator)